MYCSLLRTTVTDEVAGAGTLRLRSWLMEHEATSRDQAEDCRTVDYGEQCRERYMGTREDKRIS